MSDRASFQHEVDKLVASHVLHGSESLCKLLKYLAKQAQEHPGSQVKEYQIATEVFGRQADFDPQLDSMVRVQAGRLRAKLAEYYSSEGVADRLVVELPKGSYVLTLRERIDSLGAKPPDSEPASVQPHNAGAEAKQPVVLILSIGLIAALLAIVGLISASRMPNAVKADPVANVPMPLRIFWSGFAKQGQEPWVIFSNAPFVGRPDTGMRYYNASVDRNTFILDHYTGVGEVLAVHNLDLLFGALHQSIRVKRGSLFSLDDAKNDDLIFLGSPSENLSLRELPGTTEFVFKQIKEGARAGNMEIVNIHPQADESAEYLATPSNVPLTEDYAVVALKRGISPQHMELILAGTSTMGTQAAVEYVTRENNLNELLQRMNVTKPGEMRPFEAVIRAKVTRGVPVELSLVALRSSKP